MSDPKLPYSHSEIDGRTFYHGTKADLKLGDMLQGGYSSNYTERRSPWIYFSETVFAAAWGAELARGEGPGRIYVVEPTGPFTDDPNVTDRKFPGNPTKSYRSKDPLRVVSEHLDWQGHSPEEIQAMKDLSRIKSPLTTEAGRKIDAMKRPNRNSLNIRAGKTGVAVDFRSPERLSDN